MALFNNDRKPTNGVAQVNPSTITPESGLTCVIAKGTFIQGTIKTTENIRIEGHIKGQMVCEKKLVMDGGSLVEGEITAGESTIKGEVRGTVTIHNTLHLLESSFIKGDIKAKKLHVEEGAKYDGKCLIG